MALLEIEDLKTHYRTDRGLGRAVDSKRHVELQGIDARRQGSSAPRVLERERSARLQLVERELRVEERGNERRKRRLVVRRGHRNRECLSAKRARCIVVVERARVGRRGEARFEHGVEQFEQPPSSSGRRVRPRQFPDRKDRGARLAVVNSEVSVCR